MVGSSLSVGGMIADLKEEDGTRCTSRRFEMNGGMRREGYEVHLPRK